MQESEKFICAHARYGIIEKDDNMYSTCSFFWFSSVFAQWGGALGLHVLPIASRQHLGLVDSLHLLDLVEGKKMTRTK